MIEKSSQPHQGVDFNPRNITNDNLGTSRFVKHPARHADTKLRVLGTRIGIQCFNPNNHRRLITKPNRPQNRNLPIKEGVKSVNNSRRTELAGSVRMR